MKTPEIAEHPIVIADRAIVDAALGVQVTHPGVCEQKSKEREDNAETRRKAT